MLFETLSENAGIILAMMVFFWLIQFGLTYWQMKRFYARLKVIRKGGLTAIGLSGGRVKGRNYAVLTIDDDDNIVHAEQFSGWTVLARLKPVPELEGLPLAAVLDEEMALPLSSNIREAFQRAAQDLHQAREAAAAEADDGSNDSSALFEPA